MDITMIEIEAEENEFDNSAETSTDIAVIEGKIEMVVAQMEAMEIANQKTMEEAGEWLVKNKQTQKLVKDFFEDERKRTYEEYKAVTDQIKKYTDMLTKSETIIKKKMGAYQMEQDRKRREEEEKRRKEEAKRIEAAEASGEPIPEPVEVVIPDEPEKIDKVSFVENWTFTIDDTDKIPREYMIPDEKKIRQVVKALKGDAKIPGIKVYAEKSTRVRT